jgi:hypothetical protein
MEMMKLQGLFQPGLFQPYPIGPLVIPSRITMKAGLQV